MGDGNVDRRQQTQGARLVRLSPNNDGSGFGNQSMDPGNSDVRGKKGPPAGFQREGVNPIQVNSQRPQLVGEAQGVKEDPLPKEETPRRACLDQVENGGNGSGGIALPE